MPNEAETRRPALSPTQEQDAAIAEVERGLSMREPAIMSVTHVKVQASRLRQSILRRPFEGKLVPQESHA